jgi:2'-5' RNA ligase
VITAQADLHYLWLVPEEKAQRRLASFVKSIATRLDTVAFAPHVTLLGRLWGGSDDLSIEAETLAKSLTPFDIHFTGVGDENEFFRSLFLRIALDETLAAARRQAEQAFMSTELPASYSPHLSVLYGSYPAAVKEAIRNELEPDVLAPVTIDRLQLIAGGEQPQEWRAVATFRLAGSSAASAARRS